MSLTLGLTGMDPATEAALKAAFLDANQRLNGHWQLTAESDADHVLVDMDSMYGPMSWLRLHAAGKRVIGLTSAARTQTDFRLGRPFDSRQMLQLLQDIARDAGVELKADTGEKTVPPAAEARTPATMPVAPPVTTGPPRTTVAPPAPVAPSAPAASPPPPTAGNVPAPAPAVPPPTVDAAAQPVTASPRSSEPVFADWLQLGAMTGRARYRRDDGPGLWIDFNTRQYYGSAALKPLAAYFEGMVRLSDFKPVDDKLWMTETATLGAAQPLARLQWLGGLMTGKGALLPGHDPDGRYQLNKWPQTEREYPKHFRIATAMMKGPATLPEIAAASGIPVTDVADFINANLVTGFAEFVPEPPAAPAEPSKPAGLLDRLRGR